MRDLRARLELLLATANPSYREIGSLMRSLKTAQTLALVERRVALADQKLGGNTALNLIELVGDAQERAESIDRERSERSANRTAESES